MELLTAVDLYMDNFVGKKMVITDLFIGRMIWHLISLSYPGLPCSAARR